MSTKSRYGNLGRVFKEGESELLNAIARLSILYEDLRLEIEELHLLQKELLGAGEPTKQYRTMYFLRRALATTLEFGRGLTTVRKSKEFKQAEPSIPAKFLAYITDADRFFQNNWARLKELRNEFGGHIQPAGVDFATKHLSNVVGKVTWNRSPDGWTTALECHFASDLVSGAISSKLIGGQDVRAELGEALDTMAAAFLHVQFALVALVHTFLWNRFGRG